MSTPREATNPRITDKTRGTGIRRTGIARHRFGQALCWPSDRDSGKLDDQEESPDAEDPSIYGGTGELPPQDTKPFLPPYEGRTESSETNPRPGWDEMGGVGTKGETAQGAAPSHADKSPSEAESDEGVGPSHTPGSGRAEDKR